MKKLLFLSSILFLTIAAACSPNEKNTANNNNAATAESNQALAANNNANDANGCNCGDANCGCNKGEGGCNCAKHADGEKGCNCGDANCGCNKGEGGCNCAHHADAAKADGAKADAAPARDEAAFAKLLDPANFTETAPDKFVVDVKTTKGLVKIELNRDWAPKGVDRFYNLVKGGFFSDIAIFRMVKGFVIQFGIHGAPIISSAWEKARIEDDPVKEKNVRGTLTFATAGPGTRTTQLFINLNDNIRLDSMGFAPIGKVVEGMDIIDSLNFEYAERPDQGRIHAQGNAYLKAQFPNLDYIESMTVE